MPYGKGGRLGERIDPRLMQADYSGFANAGMIQGQALAGLGEDIGGIIKQRGEQEKFIKKSEKLAQDIADLIPELAPQANAALAALNDPDASRRDRLAMAESIKDTMQVGILGLEQKREQEMLELKERELNAKAGGGRLMRMTPSQIDQYTNAGYNIEIEAQNPDGTFVVKTMERKGVGSGGFKTVQNPDTGAFIITPDAPSSYLPTPGAVADPSMIQQAAQGFTQPSLPVAGGYAAPDSGVSISGAGGVLPPRQDAGAQPLATTATGAVPNADFFARGGQEAVQVPGSMRDLEAQLKEQQISKAKAETTKSEMEVAEAKEKEAKGRDSFSSYVGSIANAYAELDRAGAAISTRKGPMENIKAFAAGTELGKSVGSAVGSEASSFRAIIDSQTPGIINVIRQSSEMGARGMDSDAERKFYLTALGSQTLPVEANVRALIELDKAYGNNDVANIVKEKNPALYARAMSDKYVYKSGKKDEPVSDDEVESILQELGL